MNSRLRVAVVGCGTQTQLAHIPALKANPFVELIALCDTDISKLRQLCAVHNIKRYYTDFARLKEDPDVNAIVIATPTHLHAPMAIAAMEYGKDVLCEMPLALNFSEAQEVVERAKRYHRRLMPCLVTRLRADVQTVKRFVEEGELGRLYYCKSGWLRGKEAWSTPDWGEKKYRSRGGVFLTLGSALLDSALWLFAPSKPISVIGVAGKHSADTIGEDTAFALIRFDNNLILTVEVGWSLLMEKDFIYFNMFGTLGAALLNPLTIHKEMHGRLVNITPQLPTRGGLRAAYNRLIEIWVDSLLRDEPPEVSMADALLINQIADAFYSSNTTRAEVTIRSE
ncbi:MAG: Gfo/Idh/MocA family oxidoreductase [candidate division WOR-3 bacterium]